MVLLRDTSRGVVEYLDPVVGESAPFREGGGDVRATALAPRCPVCSGAVHSIVSVSCARCEAPHHCDCFEWNGRCGIFGCASQEYFQRWAAMAALGDGRGSAARGRRSVRARGQSRHVQGERVVRIAARSFVRTISAFLLTIARPPSAPTGHRFRGRDGLRGPRNLAMDILLSIFCIGVLTLLWAFAGATATSAVAFGLIAAVLLYAWANLLTNVLFALGHVLALVDGSEFTLETDQGLLRRRRSLMGISLGSQTWPAKGIESVVLRPREGSSPDALILRFQEGGDLVLANDQSAAGVGYNGSDLVRLGQRLARVLEVPFRGDDQTQEPPRA